MSKQHRKTTKRVKLIASVNCVSYSSRITAFASQPENAEFYYAMGIAKEDLRYGEKTGKCHSSNSTAGVEALEENTTKNNEMKHE